MCQVADAVSRGLVAAAVVKRNVAFGHVFLKRSISIVRPWIDLLRKLSHLRGGLAAKEAEGVVRKRYVRCRKPGPMAFCPRHHDVTLVIWLLPSWMHAERNVCGQLSFSWLSRDHDGIAGGLMARYACSSMWHFLYRTGIPKQSRPSGTSQRATFRYRRERQDCCCCASYMSVYRRAQSGSRVALCDLRSSRPGLPNSSQDEPMAQFRAQHKA